MKVATCIVYHPSLTFYLNAVKACFEHWGKVVTLEADFAEISEEEARNKSIELAGDVDYCWIIDADEFILREDQDNIMSNALATDLDATMVRVLDYKTLDSVIDPQREHTPIVLAKIRNPHTLAESGFKFSDQRCSNSNKRAVPATMHHFGPCLPPDVLKWKKDNYWNKSDPTEHNKLMAMGTKVAEIPAEIKNLLEKYTFKELDNENSRITDKPSIEKEKRAPRRKRTLGKSGNTGQA